MFKVEQTGMAGMDVGPSRLRGHWLGGILKVSCGDGQLRLLLDQPVRKFRWIETTRSAKHETRNLTLLRHTIDRVWRLPKYLRDLVHGQQPGERIERGQDIEWSIEWGLTPNKDNMGFQR
jgi:hypothetical protein